MPSRKRTRKEEAYPEATTTTVLDNRTNSSYLEGDIADADLEAMVNVVYSKRLRYESTSYANAPARGLPIWQRIALSAVKHLKSHRSEAQSCVRPLNLLRQQLKAYHEEERERVERVRREQEESRLRHGVRLCNAVSSVWNRRGDTFQQLIKAEFDVAKKRNDARKQEDMLHETELLTKKLLDSIIHHPEEKGGESEDLQLSLLDTQNGKRPLRSYQRSALKWMIHLFENNLNGILADEMGLGKTVQTIALLCYFAEYRNDWGPHLIVVPTTVVLNWKAELERWAPGLKVIAYIGSLKERKALRKGWSAEDAFHVCVTSYNLVVGDRKVFRRRPWGFLVLDEAHQVKNFMSKKWQSLFDLQAQYRLLLTGTPLQNSMMELWSLFHFLLPFASAFKSNDDFKEWFSNPLDEMVTGRATLNEDVVRRLQSLIRPFMLRRLKKDVELQLPSKTEKVVLCPLSRRQRFLYDEYMQLADTKAKISRGGAGGVLGVLLALRKVCNHPDLFEPHPIQSPFVLGLDSRVECTVPPQLLLLDNWFGFKRPEASDVLFDSFPCSLLHVRRDNTGYDWYTDKEVLLRRLAPELILSSEGKKGSKAKSKEDPSLWSPLLKDYFDEYSKRTTEWVSGRLKRCREIQRQRVLAEQTSIDCFYSALWSIPLKDAYIKHHFSELCPSISSRVNRMLPLLSKFVFYLPAAVTRVPPTLVCHSPIAHFGPFRPLTYEAVSEWIGTIKKRMERHSKGNTFCPARYDGSFFLQELWPIHVRRSFSFPDRQLVIYDCGKLQFLKEALADLKKEGHRMLIFTQFTLMLDILEKFLALIGMSYLRLDGSTKAEVRQQCVDRFNSDERVTCMILSTRSGGIGLNLTGADTVIFYDSDWNPTMDLQAQDRCHRIGQTRPVTIYRLISAFTVEESILEKARERKRLNNLVIRGGQFHAIAGVEESYEDTSSAYAALAAPVNLRNFFHDLDEDTTVEGSGAVVTEGDMLLKMRDVEDDVDRFAQNQVEEELKERERVEHEDEEVEVISPVVDAPPPFQHPLLSQGSEEGVEESMTGCDEKVIKATRARQRNIIKSLTPVNQLLVLRYGHCHVEDAEERYEEVCNAFSSSLEEGDGVFPPFRPEL